MHHLLRGSVPEASRFHRPDRLPPHRRHDGHRARSAADHPVQPVEVGSQRNGVQRLRDTLHRFANGAIQGLGRAWEEWFPRRESEGMAGASGNAARSGGASAHGRVRAQEGQGEQRAAPLEEVGRNLPGDTAYTCPAHPGASVSLFAGDYVTWISCTSCSRLITWSGETCQTLQ